MNLIDEYQCAQALREIRKKKKEEESIEERVGLHFGIDYSRGDSETTASYVDMFRRNTLNALGIPSVILTADSLPDDDWNLTGVIMPADAIPSVEFVGHLVTSNPNMATSRFQSRWYEIELEDGTIIRSRNFSVRESENQEDGL